MHFKHFWVPCLHIIFFTSRLECSRKLNEKMKWNSGIPAGIPAAAGIPVGWHRGIPCRISKQSIRTNGAQDFHSCDWRVSSHLRGNFEPHLIRMKKSSYQTWLESHWSKMRRKKCFSDQMSCFRKEPSDQNIVFLCCCSSEFLSENIFICYRIEFFW